MAKLAAASNTSSGPVCHGTGDTVLSERVSLESSSALLLLLLLLLAALARTRLCFRPGWGRGLHIDDEDEPGLEEPELELDLERRGALLDLPQLVYSQARPLQRHLLQAL